MPMDLLTGCSTTGDGGLVTKRVAIAAVGSAALFVGTTAAALSTTGVIGGDAPSGTPTSTTVPVTSAPSTVPGACPDGSPVPADGSCDG